MATSHVTIRVDFEDRATRESERSFRRIRSELQQTERQAAGTSMAFGGLQRALVGIATVEGVRRLGMAAHGLAVMADQARFAELAFERLAVKAGTTAPVELARLRLATQQTISDLELMQRVGAGVDAGLTFDQAVVAVEYLRRYSLAFGKDFNQLMQTTFTGLQRGSVAFLDDAGIVMSASDQMYEGMGDLQKKVALVDQAIQMMADRMDTLPEPTDGAALATDRLAAAWSNLGVAIGDVAGGPVTWVLELMADRLAIAQRNIEATWDLARDVASNGIPVPAAGSLGMFGGVGQYATPPPTTTVPSPFAFPAGSGIAIGGVPTRPSMPFGGGRGDLSDYMPTQAPSLAPNLEGDLDARLAQQFADGMRMVSGEMEAADRAAKLHAESISDVVERTRALGSIEQDLELVRLRAAGASETTIAGVQALMAAEQERAIGLLQAAEAARVAAAAQAQLFQRINEVASVVTRVVPEMRGFVDAGQAVLQGNYFGAFIQGIHGVLDVLGVARTEEERRLEVLERVTQSIRSQTRSIHDSLLGADEGMATELRRLQASTAQPLLDYYDDMVAQATSAAQRLDIAEIAMGNLVATLSAVEYNVTRGRTGLDRYSLAVQSVLQEIGQTPEQLYASLTSAFSPPELTDIAYRMFDVRDAFIEVSSAGKRLADNLDPARLALEATFDAQEMALRQRASDRFAAAGSDPVAQRQVFLALEAEIAAMRRSREAALRVVPSTSAPSPAARPAGGESGGGGTGGYSDPYTLAASEVPWPSTVTMVRDDAARHEPDHWSWLVNIPANLQRYERDWWQTLSMRDWRGATNWRHVPEHWGDLVNLPASLQRYERDWWQTLSMRDAAGATNRRHAPAHWSWLTSLPADLAPWQAPWPRAVEMFDDPRFRHRPTWWGSLVDVSQTSPILVPIDRIVRPVGTLRLDLTQFIDRRQLQDDVEAIVNRLVRDRKIDYSSGGSGGF